MEFKEYFPIYDKLTRDQQLRLSAAAALRTIAQGTLIRAGSDDCLGLLLVTSGQLRAYINSEDGREITVYRLLERDMCLFSASCIMRGIQFEIYISAEKDTCAWLIPADVYRSLMDSSAAVANYTNEVMAGRFSEVMWLLQQILWKSFDRRLAAFLIEEAQDADELQVTHEKIALHLGTAREVVTRMLKYFQDEGLVQLGRGRIRICDPDRLRRLAQ